MKKTTHGSNNYYSYKLPMFYNNPCNVYINIQSSTMNAWRKCKLRQKHNVGDLIKFFTCTTSQNFSPRTNKASLKHIKTVVANRFGVKEQWSINPISLYLYSLSRASPNCCDVVARVTASHSGSSPAIGSKKFGMFYGSRAGRSRPSIDCPAKEEGEYSSLNSSCIYFLMRQKVMPKFILH